MQVEVRHGMKQYQLLSTEEGSVLLENQKGTTCVISKTREQTSGSEQMIIVFQFQLKCLMFHKMDMWFC